MLFIPLDELETDPHSEFHDVRFRGELFTGVGVARTTRSRTEWLFENGLGHGRCFTVADDGQLLEEFTLERGAYVGESKRWYPDGTLRSRTQHTSPRVEERFSARGQRVEFFDEAQGLRQTWYDDGVLRSERRGDETREFTRSGALAFSWVPRSRDARTVYEGLRFHDDVLHRELESLAEDWSREPQLFAWLKYLQDTQRDVALSVLRRLLAQSNLFVVATALSFAGNTGWREARADLERFVGDARVPPQQWHDGRGRAATRTLGETATAALAALDAQD